MVSSKKTTKFQQIQNSKAKMLKREEDLKTFMVSGAWKLIWKTINFNYATSKENAMIQVILLIITNTVQSYILNGW